MPDSGAVAPGSHHRRRVVHSSYVIVIFVDRHSAVSFPLEGTRLTDANHLPHKGVCKTHLRRRVIVCGGKEAEEPPSASLLLINPPYGRSQ